jgi:hypothetical protein
MVRLKKYIPQKKNLFIFSSYPEVFDVEDTYMIVGSKQNLLKISFLDVENVFTVYTLPVWIKHRLSVMNLNIFHLNSSGNVVDIKLFRVSSGKYRPDEYLALKLLQYKAKMIDSIFCTSEAEELLNFSLKNRTPLSVINRYLDFIPKAVLMNTLKLDYRLTSKRAVNISTAVISLIDNIVPLSFYSQFIDYSLSPDSGFLNKNFPSLSRDLTEIPRLRFKKKIIHLFQTHFFEKRDLSEKYFPQTTVKILKQLSTYFFYGNRFKRMKSMYYYMEAYKRNRLHEVFDRL